MKEIDAFLEAADESEGGESNEDVLKKLLDLHDKALMLHHPVAKGKRVKLLKQEIIKVRRKLSMDKAGTSPGFKPKAGGTPSPVKKKKPREVLRVSLTFQEFLTNFFSATLDPKP